MMLCGWHRQVVDFTKPGDFSAGVRAEVSEFIASYSQLLTTPPGPFQFVEYLSSPSEIEVQPHPTYGDGFFELTNGLELTAVNIIRPQHWGVEEP